MGWKLRVRFRFVSKQRQRINHRILMQAAAEEGSVVHSDDRTCTIRLDTRIKASTEKIVGSTVAVYKGTLLRQPLSFPPSACQPADRKIRGPVSTPGLALRAVEAIAQQPIPSLTAPSPKPQNRTIIVKIFAVGSGSWSRAQTEVAALKKLKARGCKHAPEYLCDFEKRSLGGVTRYVLMTKAPGVTLSDASASIWMYDRFWRARVKRAFDEAIRAVHACGVDNASPYRRNVLWDAQGDRCYIVDFERADLKRNTVAKLPAQWSDFEWWMNDFK